MSKEHYEKLISQVEKIKKQYQSQIIDLVDVFIVVQTRKVSYTDYIVATFKTLSDAEKWVCDHCYEYGDCIGEFTGKFIRPFSYQTYINGQERYMFDKPALKIEIHRLK